MKKLNKSSLSALLIIFGFFLMTLNFWDNSAISQPIFTEDGETNESLPNTSQFIPRTIRVAIYNETDTTLPSYASVGFLNNDSTGLKILLEGAGYQVSELNESDILAHKLITADYDVFIMVDNLPRDSITDLVKEFWLGGGGIFSFDSAISYICYAGMIPHESEGSDNYGLYWHYSPWSTTQNITARHPITKDYQINDTAIEYNMDWAAFNWTALQSTSIASDITKLATKQSNSNLATVVACDPHLKGGRVVQMLGNGTTIGENMDDMIIDAIDWLCPRPKGRILYDLSHEPNYGVDAWDSPYALNSERFYLWRDNLVNRSYTFDKFYLGNYTTANLAPYDVLIITTPNINFTSSEVSSVMNWVNNGGGLFVLGARSIVYSTHNLNINYLLSSTGLNINVTNDGSQTIDYKVEHPTVEGCTELYSDYAEPGLINYTGNAFPIWGNSHYDIVIGGQEYGNGRIILSGDMYFLRMTALDDQDNLQFGINIANWLTASQAKVLILVTNHGAPDPNDNVYKGPVATALNDLGIKFYLTFTCPYFNLSLTNNYFELVIVDQNNGGGSVGDIVDYASDVINYMENGGRIIIRSFEQKDASPLWDYLGYTPIEPLITPPVVYIWNAGHRIFTTPAHYSANNITTSLNSYFTDFVNVTLHNNATGIAGLTNISSVNGSAIILGVNGRAISNTFGITEYYDDTDDSTYPDGLEIWENEIAFMLYQTLSVGINNPHTNDIFNATAPDFIITTEGMFLDDTWYTLNDGTEYHIPSTSGTLNLGAWDGLPEGDISLKFYVEDLAGNLKYTGVNVVKDSQGPNITITSPSAGDTFGATALSFIVEITDEHLDKMWYTLNSGSTKYFFTANGSIDQSAWDALADGSITIQFYANDTVSNEAFKTVSVELSTGGNGGPGIIPGYNSYILIGVIFVISAIIIKRQLKQNKF